MRFYITQTFNKGDYQPLYLADPNKHAPGCFTPGIWSGDASHKHYFDDYYEAERFIAKWQLSHDYYYTIWKE